jgi:hypothetical protein
VFNRLGQALAWRARAARNDVRLLPVRLSAWIGFKRHIGDYRQLTEDELRRTRKSDTVFVFGSGASLNAITADEWRSIESHDTIGFNWFVHQQFVRCDYQFIREIGPTDLDRSLWFPELMKYFELLKANRHFDGTTFLIQTGFRATSGNRAIGFQQVPRMRPIFLWRSIRHGTEPSLSLRNGLTHAYGTLNEVVNFAFIMGWKHIVIAGVDLYDRRYFWLSPNRPRGSDTAVDATHTTALGGIVEGLGRWREHFERSGVALYVHNPKSLLARVLPVWKW